MSSASSCLVLTSADSSFLFVLVAQGYLFPLNDDIIIVTAASYFVVAAQYLLE